MAIILIIIALGILYSSNSKEFVLIVYDLVGNWPAVY